MSALTLAVGVIAAILGLVMLAVPEYLLAANAAVMGDEPPELEGMPEYVFRAIGLVVIVIGLALAATSDLVGLV
ncbi:MAG: hypothetical protein ACOCYZ_01195 [Halococcoides sp.]